MSQLNHGHKTLKLAASVSVRCILKQLPSWPIVLLVLWSRAICSVFQRQCSISYYKLYIYIYIYIYNPTGEHIE
jgi:hypothetical protein